MNIPGMERLNECPQTKGCAAKLLFKDSEGGLWTFRTGEQNFFPHKCNVPQNMAPTKLYMGEWFNTRTRKTRWIEARLERSVRIAPTTITQPLKEWEFKGLYETDLNWKKIKDS